MCVDHHTAFSQIARVDRTFLMVNVFFARLHGCLHEHLVAVSSALGPISCDVTLMPVVTRVT